MVFGSVKGLVGKLALIGSLFLFSPESRSQDIFGPTNVYINNLTNNASITWNWATQNLVQVSGSTGGSVVGTNGFYDLNSGVSFSAVPNSFYKFERWEGLPGEYVPTNNPLELNVTTNYLDTIVAKFKKQIDPNGVAEDWKFQYGITNVLEDSDGDGVLNRDEYSADTNPTNENSFFYTFNGRNISGLYVGFPDTSTNVSYKVLECGNLLNQNWQTMYSFDGNGGSTNVSVNSTNNPAFFTGSAGRKNP